MTEQEYIAHAYHGIFKYRLSRPELKKWRAGKKLALNQKILLKSDTIRLRESSVVTDDLLIKRNTANRAAFYLSKIPFILFVGISGSLAMNNAKTDSDIDLFVITKNDTLWIARFLSIVILSLNRFSLRRANNKNERNKICLNLWIDQHSIDMPDMPQNAYTAHEIAQVVPLVDKVNTYSQWIKRNKWITGYWPHAVPVLPKKLNELQEKPSVIIVFLNHLFYVLQRVYMNGKITREKVTIHYAYFHPFDWGDIVMKELRKKGISSW